MAFFHPKIHKYDKQEYIVDYFEYALHKGYESTKYHPEPDRSLYKDLSENQMDLIQETIWVVICSIMKQRRNDIEKILSDEVKDMLKVYDAFETIHSKLMHPMDPRDVIFG